MALQRLPATVSALLCLIGAAYSLCAAWVSWLERQPTTPDTLNRAGSLAQAIRVRRPEIWLAMADVDPAHEEAYLRQAVVTDERSLPALLRLALVVEFRGDRVAARHWIDQALHFHHSYECYMAGLAQSARWKEQDRIERLAAEALRYCPRDADGVYSLLDDSTVATRVIAKAGVDRREDYFRFLIAQRKTADALRLEPTLPPTPKRFELGELLFASGDRAGAARLIASLDPEFAHGGVFNSRFRSQPTSLAFDWRLTADSRASLAWRPGELSIHVRDTSTPLELVSIFVQRHGPPTQVSAWWTGDTKGLRWTVSDVDQQFRRISLTAPPGPSRRFAITGVRVE